MPNRLFLLLFLLLFVVPPVVPPPIFGKDFTKIGEGQDAQQLGEYVIRRTPDGVLRALPQSCKALVFDTPLVFPDFPHQVDIASILYEINPDLGVWHGVPCPSLWSLYCDH